MTSKGKGSNRDSAQSYKGKGQQSNAPSTPPGDEFHHAGPAVWAVDDEATPSGLTAEEQTAIFNARQAEYETFTPPPAAKGQHGQGQHGQGATSADGQSTMLWGKGRAVCAKIHDARAASILTRAVFAKGKPAYDDEMGDYVRDEDNLSEEERQEHRRCIKGYKSCSTAIHAHTKGKNKLGKAMLCVAALVDEADPDDDTVRQDLSQLIFSNEHPEFKPFPFQQEMMDWRDVEYATPPQCLAPKMMLQGKGEFYNNQSSRGQPPRASVVFPWYEAEWGLIAHDQLFYQHML